jgi:hypothetical protein
VLLPVAGLGMATLAIGLPGRRDATPGDDAGAELGAGDTPATASDIHIAGGTSGSTRTATVGAGTGDSAAVSVRARLSPLVVAVHGALAVTTIILVLLAALGGASG